MDLMQPETFFGFCFSRNVKRVNTRLAVIAILYFTLARSGPVHM